MNNNFIVTRTAEAIWKVITAHFTFITAQIGYCCTLKFDINQLDRIQFILLLID